MTNSAPRRDNGLHAPSYDRLRDVDTHLVDGLLDRLRDVDVAAYSAPTPGRRGPYGDTVIPGGPSDAVWVDSRRRDEARQVTDRYLEEVAAEVGLSVSGVRKRLAKLRTKLHHLEVTP